MNDIIQKKSEEQMKIKMKTIFILFFIVGYTFANTPVLTYEIDSSGCSDQQISDQLYDNINIVRKGDSLVINHSLNWTCCAEWRPELDLSNSHGIFTYLSIREFNHGPICRCMCNYQITLVITGLGKGYYILRIDAKNVDFDEIYLIFNRMIWEEK